MAPNLKDIVDMTAEIVEEAMGGAEVPAPDFVDRSREQGEAAGAAAANEDFANGDMTGQSPPPFPGSLGDAIDSAQSRQDISIPTSGLEVALTPSEANLGESDYFAGASAYDEAYRQSYQSEIVQSFDQGLEDRLAAPAEPPAADPGDALRDCLIPPLDSTPEDTREDCASGFLEGAPIDAVGAWPPAPAYEPDPPATPASDPGYGGGSFDGGGSGDSSGGGSGASD